MCVRCGSKADLDEEGDDACLLDGGKVRESSRCLGEEMEILLIITISQ